MSMKHYGIFVAYAPGVMLHAEGLGRLLASFLRACRSRPDLRITIVCPSWSRPDLLELFREEGLSGSPFTLITPPRQPVALRLLTAYRRWSERHSTRPGRLRRWLDRGRCFLGLEMSALAIRLVTVRSLPGFAWLITVLLAAALVALPMLCLLPLWGLWRLGVAGARRAARHPVGSRLRTLLARIRTAPSQLPWVVRLNQAMMQHELEAMVACADRQRQVQAWFSPSAFWPEVVRCRAPHLVCVPDIVFQDAAVDFAVLDGSGRFLTNLEKIEATIASARSFTTYSAHIAETVLRDRYQVPPERITVIPHAAVDLARWVDVRGLPDDAAASRAYCRKLLGSALAKATQKSYIAGFANLDVRFLFYASQFRPSKNVLGLLRVYERLLRRRLIGLKLFLTGNPRHVPEIAGFITDHCLEHDVLCLPGLSTPELAACYRLADLAVNPSFSEGGCPFTLTEALSLGTPVVMSRIAVTTEVVTDPALQELMLFDPHDPVQMEQRILWALTHRGELLAAQQALHRRLSERTWDDVVEDHLRALEQACGGTDRRPPDRPTATPFAEMAGRLLITTRYSPAMSP